MSIEPIHLVAAMDCAELTRSIDAYLDDEFDVRERAEADAHLAVCPRCSGLVDAQGRLRAALRSKLRAAMGQEAPAARAPDALRVRIQEALARERRPLWRRALTPVPLATFAACCAGAIVVLTGQGADDALIEEAVQKHNRDLPLEVTAATVGSESIPQWFAGKLDFNPTPPHFRQHGVRVVGARLSHLRELPAAYIRYELPRGQAGLFIVDDPERRFAPGPRPFHAGAPPVRVINARGYNVAVWRQNEIVYSLVSDLDEQALFRLVQAAQAEAAR
ncbi:MAG TPA: zf-HC2 domain-containing protein [Anaeromyxobacteraceae bacterium]|nr:zf-HC2 domain-containing protein [Anaeromyxobacteraceae bacterium]